MESGASPVLQSSIGERRMKGRFPGAPRSGAGRVAGGGARGAATGWDRPARVFAPRDGARGKSGYGFALFSVWPPSFSGYRWTDDELSGRPCPGRPRIEAILSGGRASGAATGYWPSTPARGGKQRPCDELISCLAPGVIGDENKP
jgi:hypothetical protein